MPLDNLTPKLDRPQALQDAWNRSIILRDLIRIADDKKGELTGDGALYALITVAVREAEALTNELTALADPEHP